MRGFDEGTDLLLYFAIEKLLDRLFQGLLLCLRYRSLRGGTLSV